MGGKGEGRLPFRKKEVAGFKYKWSLAIQNSLRNGEAQNLYVLAPPTQCAHNHPRRFEEHFKTAGLPEIKSAQVVRILPCYCFGKKYST